MAEKKGLKEFMEDLVKDNNLAEKFKDVVDPDKVAELAEKEGYYFTAQEYEDLAMAAVNGGFSWNEFKDGASRFWGGLKTGLEKAPDYMDQAENAYNKGKDFINNIKNS